MPPQPSHAGRGAPDAPLALAGADAAERSLQWRFSWLGFQADFHPDQLIEESYRRNGGVVAWSRLLAERSPERIPPGMIRIDEHDQLVLFGNPALVSRMGTLESDVRYIHQELPCGPARVTCWCVRVFIHETCALAGLTSIVIAIFGITAASKHDYWCFGDPQVEREAVADILVPFLERVKPFTPRVLLGHLGCSAPFFADLASLCLEQHVCWAAQGPEPADLWHQPVGPQTISAVSRGGIWLVGSHARLRGQHVPSDTHEHDEEDSVTLPAPRAVNLPVEASLLDASPIAEDLIDQVVGCPTLGFGRSSRSGHQGSAASSGGATKRVRSRSD